jgi:hypothetical protein
MKQITLNIPESKFKIFLDYIRGLDYVSISNENDIPMDQQLEVNRRMEAIEKGEIRLRSWAEAEKNIFIPA